ncbi:ankyrin repeat domain-containing protein 6b isoform X2 [Sphaeramia orbicularis]|uniref:ankyrin repeat domain-containing protein 6b isoform X2 n=1 Tax=Sphaeramia orbicularis TaxID=375764 RepID=UPI0011806D52|nr:ankyrin repeat domain-containing protein 6 isoform X2 [Sphaeramia orbicularis]
MTSSGLEWDPLECPLMGFPTGCRFPFPTDSDYPDLCQMWSMSSAAGCSSASTAGGNRRCRQREEERRRQWRRADTEPGGSGTVKEGDQTALQRAAVVGNSDVISALIQEGCALDRQDKDGNTALHEVSWHGFSQSVKLLVKAGANVHTKNKAGNTALHLACQNGHAQSSKVLLLGGSRPDSKNHTGDTCLHVAARYNHVPMIRILLGAFCSVSEKNLAGDTPLHVAAALNHKKTVRLLLEAGADSHICNNAGQTALDEAREHDNPEVALLLTKAPQTFVRGRSVRKRRDRLKAEGRAQSVPRDEVLPLKDSGSAAEDTQSSDRVACKHTEPTKSNTKRRKHRQRHKDKPSLSDPLRRRDTRHSDAPHRRKGKLQGVSSHTSVPPHSYKAYQLYTLYRGKDGKIMQAPLNGCRCEPLINKLENQLEATKEEMKTQIHTVQDLMNTKMGQLDRNSKHQIRALDKMTVERVSAERSECLQRIEQKAEHERQEAEKRQASLVTELKSWCLSKLQNIEGRFTGESSRESKLQRSGSVDESLDETPEARGEAGAGGGLTELPSAPEDPTQVLALHSSPVVLGSGGGRPIVAEGGSANHYFVVHVDRSPDDDQCHHVDGGSSVTVKSPDPAVRPKERFVVSADPQRKNQELQDVDQMESRIHRASSLSPGAEHRIREPVRGRTKSHKRHPHSRTKSRGATGAMGALGVQTLEVFGEQPSEPSFTQERDNMHALEVTQYFFEAVSMQMERWYERKVQEAQWQADQRAQADRAALIDRITYLEEELRMLRTKRHDDC